MHYENIFQTNAVLLNSPFIKVYTKKYQANDTFGNFGWLFTGNSLSNVTINGQQGETQGLQSFYPKYPVLVL